MTVEASTESEYRTGDAGRAVDNLIQTQIGVVNAERQRLTQQVALCRTDIEQLRGAVEELTYASLAPVEIGLGRWATQVDSLRSREIRLRAQLEELLSALARVEGVLSAITSFAAGTEPSPLPDQAALRSLIAARAVAGQEAERFRLAREIHDGPAQVLANSIMGLEYCEHLMDRRPAGVPGELRRIKGTLYEGLEEVRRFVFDLRPASLEQDGLIRTLERYGRAYEERLGVRVTMQCEDVEPLFTPEQRFVVFRVVQEAMQNVCKHAQASEVCIEARRLGAQVLVKVRDDGVGFDADVGSVGEGHYGLQGMRERVESVYGTVLVYSEPGQGTEVRVRIPLAAQ